MGSPNFLIQANALEYTLAQMPGLEVYLEDGKIEIDNNLVETPFAPPHWPRRTGSLLAKHKPAIAVPSSIRSIESCRRRRIDPYAYLRDVLRRLPQITIQQVPEILPGVWGKPQPLRKAS